jgi:hypothetical protein
MTTMTWAQGTKSASILNLGTLASGAYLAATAIDFGTAIPYDVTLEVEVTPSTTPSGNKQLMLFAQFSLDGTNYSTGPVSGTVITNESDLFWIGTVPCNDSTLHRKQFSIAGLPVARYMKLVAKNDLGVALTSGRADLRRELWCWHFPAKLSHWRAGCKNHKWIARTFGVACRASAVSEHGQQRLP